MDLICITGDRYSCYDGSKKACDFNTGQQGEGDSASVGS